MADRETIVKCLVLLSETFGRKMNDTLIKIYLHALGDIGNADVERATARAMTDSRWFPRPVELRELAGYGKPDNAALEMEASRVWGIVIKYFDYGYQSMIPSVSFPYPINGVIEALGGWLYLCELSSTALDFLRKDFIRFYVEYVKGGYYSPPELTGTDLNIETKRISFDLPITQAFMACEIKLLEEKKGDNDE